MAYFVILSSILRGSRMKVGSTTLLRSAPGRRFAIMCESTAGKPSALIPAIRACHEHSLKNIPLPCSGSTCWVSSSELSLRTSSTGDLGPDGAANQPVSIVES